MAAALTDRTWRASTPETVEDDLSALWRDIGASGTVARAMMSNLVVLRSPQETGGEGDRRSTDIDVDSVAARHPSRVLLIEHAAVRGGDGALSARVGICTFGPPHARYGIEQIALRSTCADVSLPSLVRRFVRGGLPISLWCRDDLSRQPLLHPIASMARQLVYDSADWSEPLQGFAAVAQRASGDLADTNWRRLAPMRQAVAFAARLVGGGPWTPESVRVNYQPGDAAAGWLLAGWIASCLWTDPMWPDLEEQRDLPARARVSIRCESGDIVVSLQPRGVTIEHRGTTSLVFAPSEDPAAAIAAELHMLARDAGLRQALAAIRQRSAHGNRLE